MAFPSPDGAPPPSPAEFANSEVTDSTVVTSIVINAVFGTILFLSFLWTQTLNKKLYRYRSVSESVSLRPPDIPMPKGVKCFSSAWWAKHFMWAVYTYRASDLDILMSCGLDAFVMTKIPVVGMQLFGPPAVISICVLIPVTVQYSWLKAQSGSVNGDGLAGLTMSNIPPSNPILWLHTGLLFLFTFYGIGLLYYHFVQFARLRLRFMSRGDDLSFYAEILTDKIKLVKKQLAAAHGGKQTAKKSRAVLALEKHLAVLLKVMDGMQERMHVLDTLRATAHGPLLEALDGPAAPPHNGMHLNPAGSQTDAAADKLITPGPVGEGILPPAPQAMGNGGGNTAANPVSPPSLWDVVSQRLDWAAEQRKLREGGAGTKVPAGPVAEGDSGPVAEANARVTPGRPVAEGPEAGMNPARQPPAQGVGEVIPAASGVGQAAGDAMPGAVDPTAAGTLEPGGGELTTEQGAASPEALPYWWQGESYQVTGIGRMGEALEALKETAPIMFLERPSARYSSTILVPAAKSWKSAITSSSTGNLANTDDGADLHSFSAKDVPRSDSFFDYAEGSRLGHGLPWGDPQHTGRPHLVAVQIERYAVLVTDVAVAPYVPAVRSRNDDTRAAAHARAKRLNSVLHNDGTIGDTTRRQRVAQNQSHNPIVRGLAAVANWVFPSYGTVAEMLNDFQTTVEEQDERDEEEARMSKGKEYPRPSNQQADTDVEMAVTSQNNVQLQLLSTLPSARIGGQQDMLTLPNAGLAAVPQWATSGRLVTLTSLPREQLLAAGSQSLRKRRSSSRRMSNPTTPDSSNRGSAPAGTATANPDSGNGIRTSNTQVALQPHTEEDEARAGSLADGGRTSSVRSPEQDRATAGKVVRTWVAHTRGWQLWAIARKAVRDGRVARLPSSAAYDPVSALFTALLPNDFDRAIPIMDYRQTHLLLRRWNWNMIELDTALEIYKRKNFRPTGNFGGCHEVDKIDYYTPIVQELQLEIVKERRKALACEDGGTGAYVVLFKTQAAAAMACAQPTALSEHRGKFLVHPAPAPNDINYKHLLAPWSQRRIWTVAMIIPKAIIILFPITAFSAAFTQLDWLLCGGPTAGPPPPPYSSTFPAPPGPPPANTNEFQWDWYCAQNTFFAKLLKSLLVAWAPAWILSLYTAMILPNALHGLVQASRNTLSLSSLDREVCFLYWWFNVINVFLCGMLGGSFMQQINQALFEEGGAKALLDLLGAALPASSNFYINYLAQKTLMGLANQLLIPNGGVFWYTFRRYIPPFRWYRTVSIRDKLFRLYTTRSPRYGPVIGNMLIVFVVGTAFMIVSPIVPGVAFCYFAGAYFVWKYLMLFLFIRKFESGGLYFQVLFERLLTCLGIMVLFTTAVLATKQAWNQVWVVLITLPWIILFAGWYCRKQYGPMLGNNIPLDLAAHAPKARINPELYIHPAMHPQALGWHPDLHLVWGGIGIWGTL